MSVCALHILHTFVVFHIACVEIFCGDCNVVALDAGPQGACVGQRLAQREGERGSSRVTSCAFVSIKIFLWL